MTKQEMTKDEYIQKLKGATWALEGALIETWEPSKRLEDELDFWQDGYLFEETWDEEIDINGEKMALVSIPSKYLAIGGDSLEDTLEVADYELDYIEKLLLAEGDPEDLSVTWTDEERKTRLNLIAIIWKIRDILRQIKQTLREASTVGLKEIKTGTLTEFENSWKGALNQLIEIEVEGVLKVLSVALASIGGSIIWNDVGAWIVEHGGKLPGAITAVSGTLQKLIRTLVGLFQKMWNFFMRAGIIKDLAKLLRSSDDDEEDDGKTKFVKAVIRMIQSPVAGFLTQKIWHTEELEGQVSIWTNEAANELGLKKETPLKDPRVQVHLSEGLIDIQETLTDFNAGVTAICLAADVVALIGGAVVLAVGPPVGALVLGSIVVAGIMILVALGADALRDEPDEKGHYAGLGSLAKKTLDTIPR